MSCLSYEPSLVRRMLVNSFRQHFQAEVIVQAAVVLCCLVTAVFLAGPWSLALLAMKRLGWMPEHRKMLRVVLLHRALLTKALMVWRRYRLISHIWAQYLSKFLRLYE